jgi:predicted Zn-dependent protease
MSTPELDTAAVARALSQVGDRPDDWVDAYFERREVVEVPPEDEGPGLWREREEGFAVRLVRDGATWISSRDGLEPRAFSEAIRQVARALPAATYPEPAFTPGAPDENQASEVLDFPALLTRAVRSHHVGFPVRISVSRHRRWVQIVGPRLVPAAEVESFYSVTVESAWGRYGTLLPRLDAAAAEAVALPVVALFRSRHAPPPEAFRGTVVLGPGAVAVLLHEAVAHALEADVLARGGRPEAAVGVALGAPCLDVLDDPAGAPPEVRRATDDEGSAVCRRWLLRSGVVEQPLADAFWARTSPVLLPGSGWRGSRHLPPGPRSRHLELLPGDCGADDLLAETDPGLYLPEASRGVLDPLSGEFALRVPYARRIRRGSLVEPVGAVTLRGRVADLLSKVTAVGDEVRSAGAGWCAKGGQKLAVWATVPALRLEDVEIVP